MSANLGPPVRRYSASKANRERLRGKHCDGIKSCALQIMREAAWNRPLRALQTRFNRLIS
ncbi:MAG: hypothetical protein P8P53_12000 [Tateyamaria sp.]|nr:hypothetical protein [Tateyamaria sp.]